jgi:2-oxoglutarate ferredoxin oxidoreductase subunit beta
MDKNTLKKLEERADLYASYDTDEAITWCGGCGNYGIQNSIKRALTLENLTHKDYIHCFDVGCSGNGSDKIHSYTIHGLHGRVLPLAAGVKLAQDQKKVIAEAGDGATFSEGVNHLVHAVRSDYPIVFLLHNNQAYALTTGQPSALSPKGCVMSAAPDGVFTDPLNILQFVLSLNPTFVARTLSADTDHITEMIQQGLNHDGFAFIDILQTCPTYNKAHSNEWYMDRVKNLLDMPEYDPTDIWAARRIADISEADKIHIGVIYKNDARENYVESMPMRKGMKTQLVDEVVPCDITAYLNHL